MTSSAVEHCRRVARSWHILTAVLLMAWAVKWLFGPLVLTLQTSAALPGDAVSGLGAATVAWRYVAGAVALIVVIASVVAGVKLIVGRERGAGFARGVLTAIIVFKLAVVIVPIVIDTLVIRGNTLAMLQKLPSAVVTGMSTLSDIGCAAALLWFVGRMVASPVGEDEPEDTATPSRAVAPIVTLAVLFLVFREGLRLPMLPLDVANLRQALVGFSGSPMYLLMLSLGTITSAGAIILLMARLARARLLGPAVVLLLAIALLRSVTLLVTSAGTPFGAGGVGMATQVGLYVTCVVGMLEYSLLLHFVPPE
jgi:hypothetical protein